MFASCHGRRSRAANGHGEPVAWGALGAVPVAAMLPLLGGCAEVAGGPASWAFVCIALPLVAALAYLLGTQRARGAVESELRSARDGLRQLSVLHDGWLWQTDTDHGLLSWRGPGRPPSTDCALFGDDALRNALRTQAAFQDLRLSAAQAQYGSHAWALSATPRHDSLGRFCGFAGSATPLDDAELRGAVDAALPRALDWLQAPALLALDRGDGWRLHLANAAAGERWPGLVAGAPLAAVLAALPAGVQTLAAGETAAPAAVAGWRLARIDGVSGGPRTLLLAADASAVAGNATTAGSAEASESENFSFTVSHDLRAPIRVVEGFTRIVKEDYGRLLDRVGNDHLDRVLGAAARMNLMIDALMTLARLSSQPLARQPVNLSQLAAYVIDDLRRAAPERETEVDVDIEEGLQTHGDPTLLRLVLENLLGNAWKYSARSPRAHISLARVVQGGRAAYVVRDNGAGFDMRSADRLFGLFQRLHSASDFAGHGVGLASVRRIIRRHGGEIWAEAEPGRGAAFFFTLAA